MKKYSLPMRVLHWLIAVTILCMIAVGWTMTGMDKHDPNRALLFSLHKSFGVTVLLLVLLRLWVRLRSAVPKLPRSISPLEQRTAELAYVGFYVLMIGTPLVGFLMTNAFGFAVSWFGVALPKILTAPDKDLGKFLSNIHGILAYTMLALIAGHVSAVIKHYVFDKVNLLPRMW